MDTDIPPPAVPHLWVYFLIIILLLILSALISGSEVAFFSLKEKPGWDDKVEPKARKPLKRLLQHPQLLLATILTANNLVNITIVIISTYLVDHWLHSGPPWLRFLIEVILITTIILFFGEILPKVIATHNDLLFARKTATLIFIFQKLFSFFTYPMVALTKRVQKYLHFEPQRFSREELSHVFEMARSHATSDEQRILSGILRFGQTEAKQIMKPRVDIFALEIHEPFEQIIEKISRKGYSRIPVYEGDLDHIKGILFAKDLLPYLSHKNFRWQQLLRPAFFTPENIKLDDLLKDFQRKHTHLAIVVDEYGGTSGLITLEDVIEEVLGEEIRDEYDKEKLPYRRVNKNTFLFEAKTPLNDFYKYMKLDQQQIQAFEQAKGPNETLAGLLLELTGDLPQPGDKIRFANFTFTVKEVQNHRLNKILVTKR